MLTDEEIYSFLEGYPNDEEIDFYLRRNLERMDVKKWYPIFQAAIEQAKERQAVTIIEALALRSWLI